MIEAMAMHGGYTDGRRRDKDKRSKQRGNTWRNGSLDGKEKFYDELNREQMICPRCGHSGSISLMVTE